MERASRRTQETGAFRRACATPLFYVLLLGSAGHLHWPSWAEAECGVTRTTPLRVQDQTGVAMLRAAANCTDGGSLDVDWTGAITLESPIVIASGMFLSITGEDTLAEVLGGSQTRMFNVSRGGGLTLTQMKLSEGSETTGGAIVSDSATLTLNGCLFQGNEATDGDGGAVWVDGGNVTIVGGEFIGNVASGYGGAVAATGAVDNLVVQGGSIFKGNTALIGGALYCSGVPESSSVTSCVLSDTEFSSNTATGESEEKKMSIFFSEGVDGGGAVELLFAAASITDSLFHGNHARFSGGALIGGADTDIDIDRCTFANNTADKLGGAIAAASMTLGGGTQLTNNTSGLAGGAVYGWNKDGLIKFNSVICSRNTAGKGGGCFRSGGTGIINDGTVMHDNTGLHGGCLYASENGELHILGGDFMCQADRQGGFLHVRDDALINITGGIIANNVAGSKGGAVYCSSNGGSTLNIEGGVFKNNTALELGGVISAWGELTSVQISGGVFSNNTAKLFGGFLHLDGGASVSCKGATVGNNYAGSQGGGIYARGSPQVISSCDIISNQSPQGAALYLSGVENVTLKNHAISDNLAFSGSVVYMTDTSVVADGVSFTSTVGLQEDSSNRAVQSDKTSVLVAKDCAFNGWRGDTVVYHKNSDADSLFLDSCDFSGSSTTMAVFSLNSDAKIRNAVVDDTTFAKAEIINNSVALVNRALNCSSANVCGPGRCLNSALGVLCECLDVEICLDDGGEVALVVKSPPATETYSPDPVSFELEVSSAGDGATYVIWELGFDAKDLILDVTPSSGILPSGANVTVMVTGTPTSQDVNGNLASNFHLKSVGTNVSSFNPSVPLEVNSTFYLCSIYKYAEPPTERGSAAECKPCMSISDGKGLACDSPGATLASLPIRQGYWRSGRESRVVHKCINSEACAGATEIWSTNIYCATGYQGPYCAVCSAGYGRGVSNTCRSCDNSTNTWRIIWVVAIALVVVIFLVILAVVFLVGGCDAVDRVRTSMTGNVSEARLASMIGTVSEESGLERHIIRRGAEKNSSNNTIAPAMDFTWTDTGRAYVRPSRSIVGVDASVQLSDMPTRHASDTGMPARGQTRPTTVAGAAVCGTSEHDRQRLLTNDRGNSKCCGLGVNINSWVSRLPLDKIKILVVVWQIQSVFATITRVEFPASYSMFLSWVGVLSFDIGHMLSASCILPSVTFYASLLISTLTPLVLVAGLMLTYQMAKCRAGIGSAGVIARRAAWSRHVAAGLLLTFLVFTSASTLVFETFACDDAAGDGKSYLRADYSIMCGSSRHTFFKGYALLMILVYPVGIPALYAVILWNKRELLNPRNHTTDILELDGAREPTTRADSSGRAGIFFSFLQPASRRRIEDVPWQDSQDSKKRERARRENPELTPFVFLWKDFGPGLFYYEVIECGRRMLLTGVLIFIAPNSSTQMATACFLAFASLLGFELMRPHLDAKNTWLYRLGCVVIFVSYFLALLIKVDAATEGHRTAVAFFLVAINAVLVVAFITTSWLAVKQSVEELKDAEVALT